MGWERSVPTCSDILARLFSLHPHPPSSNARVLFQIPEPPLEMSDKEAQPAIGGDLQEAITKFEKGKLNTCETKDKTILPDQATIEQEKKAAQEEASGK